MSQRKKRPDLHADLIRMNAEAGTYHAPGDEIVQVTLGEGGLKAEAAEAKKEAAAQGCTCDPTVTVKMSSSDTLDGIPVAHFFFDHEPWCPLLRSISEGTGP